MATGKNKQLFDELNYRGLQLTNRIVMAPMTRARATGNLPNELMADYYAQRASAGLIITEGNAPSPNGLGYARIPGIFSAEQIAGWKKITKAVHENGGKIFTQLMHVGRIAHSANMPAGSKVLAPSAISANGDMWTDAQGMQKTETPSEMTSEEIRATIQEFVRAAENAIEAGFDGVELHAANGYLLEQFLNPQVNKRTDDYGGSIENNARFVLEVTKAVADAIGAEKTGVRLSPYNTFNTMPVYGEIFRTYEYLSKQLDALDIAYIHLIDYAIRANEDLDLMGVIRSNFRHLLILNGGYTKERADAALTEESADLISFGSSFIANPDLPFRLKNELELNRPDIDTFYTPGETGYTDYPFAGK